MSKLTTRTTLDEIQDGLREDGYPADRATAKAVKSAWATRSLVWTRDRLTTTDRSRLDLRPEGR